MAVVERRQKMAGLGEESCKDATTAGGQIQPQTVDPLPVVAVMNKATQELARKMEAQEAELKKRQAKLDQQLARKETLLQNLAALEARDQAREDRLAQIESSLKEGAAHVQRASLKLH